MKNKLFTALFATVLSMGFANGAITIIDKNFTSASVGNPIVDATGAAVAKSTIFAQSGLFNTTVTQSSLSTLTASQILSMWVPASGSTVTNSTITGCFSGAETTTLLAYPTSGGSPSQNVTFVGNQAYILVGNNSTIANSTLIAVFATGQNWNALSVGSATNTLPTTYANGSWIYGATHTVTTQPTNGTSFNGSFSTGIVLTSVPEPSAALLGALGVLGLLRRRRI